MLRHSVSMTAAPRRCFAWLVLGLVVGCEKAQTAAPPVLVQPRVRVARPERRTIERTIGQPAFMDAYEQTSIYPKLAGYIEKWSVDIGDRIQKSQVIATLFVPELQAELEQKKAQLAQDRILIEVARQLVKVAEHNLSVARAQEKKARADLEGTRAAVDRWTSEVKRLTKLSAEDVIDKQILEESQKQLKSNIAMTDSAAAGVSEAEAIVLARQTDIEKSRVDVQAAQAKAKVTEAEVQRFNALVGYTQLMAPYDGVVVARSANTGDFVQPAGGDKSAERGSADQSAAKGSPIYVVARTDRIRVFVDVPEIDAKHVAIGTESLIRVQALDDREIQSAVTRTSWSLHRGTRTLRAEVDVPNPKSELLPGMYAYATLSIKRSDVFAVPVEGIVELGNQTCCYLLESGRAAKVIVQTGVGDGKWIEVLKKKDRGSWTEFTGQEEVLLGDLAEIADGQAVNAPADETKKAAATVRQSRN